MKPINQKRYYQKPAIQVYELKQRPQLLQGSGLKAGRKSYDGPITETWDEPNEE